MPQIIKINRTGTPDKPPTGLVEGELSVEMASTPPKLWVGVPTSIDPSGKRLLNAGGGGVAVGETPSLTPVAGDLWYESDTGVLWLWYVDADSAQWVQVNGVSAGGGAVDAYTKAESDTNFVNAAGDAMTGVLQINAGGGSAVDALTVQGGGIRAKNSYVQSENGSVLAQHDSPYSQLVASTMTGATGISLGVDTAGAGYINLPHGNYPLYFQTSGLNNNVSISETGIMVTPPLGSYSIDARSAGGAVAGIIGWADGTVYYGQVGAYQGATYSFYGNTNALCSGVWQDSDLAFKTVTGELDRTAALAAVNSIAIKTFTPSSDAAKGTLYGGAEIPGGVLYGWIAQEVEPILPVAIRDVGVPADDLNTRAAIKGIALPTRDTPEATSLGAENLSFKAINDHFMLATLWAAVQKLSAEVEALKAGA